MTTPTKTRHRLRERFRAHRRRIDALRGSRHNAAWGLTSGFSAQLAAIRRDHKSARASLAHLTRTPESAEDWKRLHEQLCEALDRMDAEIGALEHMRETVSSGSVR